MDESNESLTFEEKGFWVIIVLDLSAIEANWQVCEGWEAAFCLSLTFQSGLDRNMPNMWMKDITTGDFDLI